MCSKGYGPALKVQSEVIFEFSVMSCKKCSVAKTTIPEFRSFFSKNRESERVFAHLLVIIGIPAEVGTCGTSVLFSRYKVGFTGNSSG